MRRLVRGVGELLEAAADEVGGLLADVHRVVADSLQTARDERRTRENSPIAEETVRR